MTFKLRIKRFRRTPSPFFLFDFSKLADPKVRELFEVAVAERFADDPSDPEDRSGFTTLKNAIHEVAAVLLPKVRPPGETPVRYHPSIVAGRSAAAILNAPSSQIVPELYWQVLEDNRPYSQKLKTPPLKDIELESPARRLQQ
jgi:hypothetical protein